MHVSKHNSLISYGACHSAGHLQSNYNIHVCSSLRHLSLSGPTSEFHFFHRFRCPLRPLRLGGNQVTYTCFISKPHCQCSRCLMPDNCYQGKAVIGVLNFETTWLVSEIWNLEYTIDRCCICVSKSTSKFNDLLVTCVAFSDAAQAASTTA